MDKGDVLFTTIDNIRQRVEEITRSSASGSSESSQLLQRALAELQISIEELLVAEEELLVQNEELIQARQVTKAHQMRYQELFYFAPDAYLTTDRYGKIQAANRAAAQLLNMKEQFLVGKLMLTFIYMPDRKSFRSQLTKLAELLDTRSNPSFSSKRRLDNHDMPLQDSRAVLGYLGEREEWEIRLLPNHQEPIFAAFTVAIASDPEGVIRWSFRDITERKRAESALAVSEAKFRTLAETSRIGIFLLDAGNIIYSNPAASQITGRNMEDLLGKSFRFLLHPDEQDRFAALETASVEAAVQVQHPAVQFSFADEVRFRNQNEEECLCEVTIGIARNEGDKLLEVITANDITQRVKAERSRNHAIQRMVTAQEEERRRIARELHDQLGQEITGLILGLKSLQPEISSDSAAARTLANLQQIAHHLSQDLHHVAYELRPTSLDDLGLKEALANLLENWSKRNKIPVQLEATNIEEYGLTPEASTAVYRIVQEAMNNILRHAQSSRVSVILEPHHDYLRVIVEDNGMGFDIEQTLGVENGKKRLGILSMRERAELVGGGFHIESLPGAGTTVFADIPFMRAANGQA